MMASMPTASAGLRHAFEVLDQREAGTIVAGLSIHGNTVVEEAFEPPQIGAKIGQLCDLGFDGPQVLANERQDMLAWRGALVPYSEDPSDVGQRDPERLRPSDEAEPLHCVFVVEAISGRGPCAGPDEADPVIVPEGLGLESRQAADSSDG
jgi:hypothetical protein